MKKAERKTEKRTEKRIKGLRFFITVFLVAAAAALLCAVIFTSDGIDAPEGTLVFSVGDDFYLYDFEDEPVKLTADGYDKITHAAGWMTDEVYYCIAKKGKEYFALRFENGEIAQTEAIPAKPNTVKRFGNRLFIAYDESVLYLSAVDGSVKTLTKKTGAKKILTSKSSFVLLTDTSYRLCKRDNGVLTVGEKMPLDVDGEAFVFMSDEATVGFYNKESGETFSLNAKSGEVTKGGFELDSTVPFAYFEGRVLCTYKPKLIFGHSFWLFDTEASALKAVKLDKMLSQAKDVCWEG